MAGIGGNPNQNTHTPKIDFQWLIPGHFRNTKQFIESIVSARFHILTRCHLIHLVAFMGK